MALVNLSSTIVPVEIPYISYNPDILKIFKEDGEIVNSSNIYISLTEPPILKNVTIVRPVIPPWKETLNKYLSPMMTVNLVILMLGMGSHVYWKEIRDNFWPPLPIIIGMCGQFIILPALAFSMTIIFKMLPYVALGCLITSCSPGGAFSNFFTYWVHGDVALSLVMTTCSTILSFGTMPLNLWIYSPNIVGAESENIVIPYKNILITLGFVVGPVIVGMIIRHWNRRIADRITTVSSIIGYLMVAFTTTCSAILFWNSLKSAGWQVHISVIILPMSGIIIAYIVAYISKRSHKVCRTIAIETASQNIPAAMGIIALSFPEIEIRNEMMLYPTLYAIYMVSEICIGSAIFRWYYYLKQKNKKSLSSTEGDIS